MEQRENEAWYIEARQALKEFVVMEVVYYWRFGKLSQSWRDSPPLFTIEVWEYILYD